MPVVQFNQVSEEEKELLYNATALVTYLIGGADNNFDEKERAQSAHLVNIRTEQGDPMLFDYYLDLQIDFAERVAKVEAKYGVDSVNDRTALLVAELEKLNEILPKLDDIYARAYLKALRTLAKGVAEASGGLLGFLEISYEEEHLMGLTMITFE